LIEVYGKYFFSLIALFSFLMAIFENFMLENFLTAKI